MTKYTEAGIRFKIVDEASPVLEVISKKAKDTFNKIVDESVKAGGKLNQINKRIDSEILRETSNISKITSEIDKKIGLLQREKDSIIREINNVREKNIREVDKSFEERASKVPAYRREEYRKSFASERAGTLDQVNLAAKEDIKATGISYAERIRALRDEKTRGDKMVQAMERLASVSKEKARTELEEDPNRVRAELSGKKPQDLLKLEAEEKRAKLLQMGMLPSEQQGLGKGLLKYLAGGALAGLAISQVQGGFATMYGAGRAPGLTMEEMAIQQERARGQLKSEAIGGVGTALMGAGGLAMMTGNPIGWGVGGALTLTGIVANLYSSKTKVDAEQEANFKEAARNKREEFYQARGFYRGVTGGYMSGGIGGRNDIGFNITKKNIEAVLGENIVITPPPSANADGQRSNTPGSVAKVSIGSNLPQMIESSNRTVAGFERIGMEGKDVYQLGAQTARAYLENRNNVQRAYDVAIQAKAFGLDTGQVLGMAGSRKLFTGDTTASSMINTLQNAGATNANMPSMMNMFQQLTQTLGQSIEKMSVALPASIISVFGGGKGSWNVNDPRFMGNISKIQQGLVSPQNDYQKALSFMSLSQNAPGSSFWELTKMQEQGLGTPKALSSLMDVYKKSYGTGDMYKMAVKQRFGLSADVTDSFLQSIEEGKIDTAFGMIKEGGSKATAGQIGVAEEITSKTQQEKAALSNIMLSGSEEALEQAKELWSKTFKLLNEETYDYVLAYHKNVSDIYTKLKTTLPPNKS